MLRQTPVDRASVSARHIPTSGGYLRSFAQVTKYYSFGGQRIAMRRDHILFFLAADHLGDELEWGSSGQQAWGARL